MTGSSNVPVRATVPHVTYSEEFQTKLAEEMEGNALVACSPIDYVEPCSAWKRAIIDYGDHRRKTRVAEEE